MVQRFKDMKRKLELSSPKDTVRIVCYEKDKAPNTIKSMNPTGAVGELFCVENVVFIGVGEKEPKEPEVGFMFFVNVYLAMASLYKKLSANYKEYRIEFEPNDYLGECYYALVLASYKFYDPKKDSPSFALNFDANEFGEVVELAHAQNYARFLGDTPANLMTPSIFVDHAKDLLEGLSNVTIKVLDQDECKKLGMNLFYSVAQGSEEKGKLLTLKLMNGTSAEHDIALVGKGVTFDSGGISLKPSLNMHEMKYDMMGGATMLTTFYMAAKFGLKTNLTCTIPLVENLPSGKATKPGDVYVGLNGKSVEINNTDAEGRLILADALTYAQRNYEGFSKPPTYLLDAATLTGAMMVALGDIYVGYFTNDDAFSSAIMEAASNSHEFMNRMPLSTYYKEAMSSEVADICNIGGGPKGGACTAAIFLNEFVDSGVKYVHFDIAGVMTGFPKELFGKGATARPLPAFYELLKTLSKK